MTSAEGQVLMAELELLPVRAASRPPAYARLANATYADQAWRLENTRPDWFRNRIREIFLAALTGQGEGHDRAIRASARAARGRSCAWPASMTRSARASPSARASTASGFPASPSRRHCSASRNIGFTTLTEMTERLRHITNAVDIPVVADGRRIRQPAEHHARRGGVLRRAGAAGIQLGDETSETCPYLGMPTKVLPLEEAVLRFRAAAEARGKSGM